MTSVLQFTETIH